jgi:two-component system sensor histidine kinase MprB
MTFRTRIVLASAGAVAVAIAVASVLVFVIVRGQLRSQVDEALLERVPDVSYRIGPEGGIVVELPPQPLGGAGGVVQLVRSDGSTFRPGRSEGPLQPLPVTDRTLGVASGSSGQFFEDMEYAGAHLRLLTASLAPGLAVQVARPLDEVDGTLRTLAWLLGGFTAAGVGAAALLGAGVARTSLAPVRRLTEATERVTVTGDLNLRVESGTRDELGRLAANFNRMLAALEQAVVSQRQLVADASHELRTPLTSLRTNVEVLAVAGSLPAEERERLLADVVAQLEELTTLVGDLVELSREGLPPVDLEDVRLDEVVAEAVDRTRRRSPEIRFVTDMEPTVVRGDPSALSRAVTNLLDNAAKWTDPHGQVDVTLRGCELTVRDRGPGVDQTDLPKIFDRFYRAPSARGTPGSGLGLAIVRKVAEAHGGTVSAERAEGGGARFRFVLSGPADAPGPRSIEGRTEKPRTFGEEPVRGAG